MWAIIIYLVGISTSYVILNEVQDFKYTGFTMLDGLTILLWPLLFFTIGPVWIIHTTVKIIKQLIL